MEEGVEFFTKNMLINMNVMKVCFQTKVVKLISMLSTCIFPDKVSYPITEDYLHDGVPHWSNEGYAYSKRMVDVLSRAYNKQHNTKYICVIPGNLYGKYDNFNLNDSHVLPALIHKCYIANKNSNNLIVNGSGRPLRQFTYAVDLAKLLVWALDSYEDNEPIIFSSNEEHSISSVCDIICKCMKYSGEVVHDFSKEDGQYKKTVSNKKLQKLVDFKFTSIEEGIYETVEWFNENYTKDIRK
jgi:GDP-L-fucose synthase